MIGRALGPGRLTRDMRARTPRWVLDWTDARGKRQRKTLSTDRRTAEQIRREIIHRRDLELAGLGGVAGMAMPLAELKELHIADLRGRTSDGHVTNVASILDRALTATPARQVKDLRVHDLLRYRAELVAAGASNRTANHAIDRIRAMLAWGARAGLIAESPIRAIDRLPEREKDKKCVRRAMSESEIMRFLTASEADDRANAKRQANGQLYRGRELRSTPRVPQTPLWRALIETGARWGELTLATWADVDLHGRVLTFRAANTKAGRSRSVPLLDGVVTDLVRLRATHADVLGRPVEPDDRVFLAPGGVPWSRSTNNAMRILKRVLERAGIPRVDAAGKKIDIHALRTTCGSRMARNGVGIVHTQRLLGHSSITLTEKHYVALGVEEIRAAMEAVPGTGEKLKEVG